jgi:hypothetical protein
VLLAASSAVYRKKTLPKQSDTVSLSDQSLAVKGRLPGPIIRSCHICQRRKSALFDLLVGYKCTRAHRVAQMCPCVLLPVKGCVCGFAPEIEAPEHFPRSLPRLRYWLGTAASCKGREEAAWSMIGCHIM